jgi:uroporphyrinogen-III synthase
MNARDLRGLGIVVTRPRAAAEALAAALAGEGARPFVFPALAIEDLPPSAALESALARLPGAALAVFVSAHAVQKGLAAAQRHGPWPASLPVAAVGEATAGALRAAGFAQVIAPHERHDSDALLALPALQDIPMRGRDVVIFRGRGGRERLREGLESRGARVAYAECYERVRPGGDPAALLAAWGRGEVQAVSALSAETLENFMAMVGAEGARLAARTALVVPHEAVGRHAAARNFERIIVAELGADGVADALGKLRTG